MKLIEKIKKFVRWLFRWLKHIVLIIICFIAYLFSGKKSSKLELKKEEMKKGKSKKNTINNITTNIDTNKPLVKDSILKLSKEELRVEIINFYCQELEQKELYLTKEDFEIIDILEEKIALVIESELTRLHFKNLEEVKEKIEEIGKIELASILDEKILKEPIITENPKKEDIIQKYTTYKKMEEKKIEKGVSKKEDNSPIIFQSNPSLTEESVLEKKNSYQKEVPPTPNISQELLEEDKPDLTFQTPKLEPEIVFTSPIPDLSDLVVKEAAIQPDSIEILEREKVSDAPTPSKPVIEKFDDTEQERKEFTIEEEKLVETKPDTQKEREKIEEPKGKDKQKEEKKQEYITINLSILETQIAELEHTKNKELEKTDLEDKNYDSLLIKVDTILKEVKEKQKMNLNAKDKQKLKEQELKLENLKSNIENNLENDLTEEEMQLQEDLTEQELTTLEQELKNIHLEYQIDLNQKLLTKVEDLEYLSKDRLSIVEKELIKQRLNKICKVIELPSILLLPFFRNRYFFFFTTGIFINKHFNLLNSILKHQTIEYQDPVLDHIKKGSDALDEALKLTTTNISYLNNLEQDILRKYPELSLDQEYLSYINNLKYSLMKNEEKMLKKKKMIEKYNLKYKGKARKLKKKVA